LSSVTSPEIPNLFIVSIVLLSRIEHVASRIAAALRKARPPYHFSTISSALLLIERSLASLVGHLQGRPHVPAPVLAPPRARPEDRSGRASPASDKEAGWLRLLALAPGWLSDH
jgi:hypothetical protein